MPIRLKKVKVTSDNKIHMAYEQKGSGGWDEYSLTCSDKPRPELLVALEALAPHVIEMCELPESYLDRITVRSVSYSYGGDQEVMGATISGQMALYYSNCGLNINTPHKASDSYSDGPADDKQLLDSECIKALGVLEDEAIRYIQGDRAQTVLFAAAPAASAEVQIQAH